MLQHRLLHSPVRDTRTCYCEHSDALALDLADRLRLLMFVPLRRPSADDLRALLLEARFKLVHRVAVVVRVACLVAHAEDRHLLAGEIETRQVAVEELIPSGAATLAVSTGVPSRRPDDQAVGCLDIINRGVTNVSCLQARGSRDVARGRLRVARSGGIQKHGFHLGRTSTRNGRTLQNRLLRSSFRDTRTCYREHSDALALDLLDPLLSAPLRLIRLVVLVERATHEVVAADRLRLLMFVPLRGPSADDLRALLLEARFKLVHRVAVVVRVACLVAHAEDRHLLAREIETRQVAVEELVPSGAAPLAVSAGVPSRRPDDQAVGCLDIINRGVTNVSCLQARGSRDVARGRLRVARSS